MAGYKQTAGIILQKVFIDMNVNCGFNIITCSYVPKDRKGCVSSLV